MAPTKPQGDLRALGAIRHMRGKQDTQFIDLLRSQAAFGDDVGYPLRSAQYKDIGAFSPGLVRGPGPKLKHLRAVFQLNSVRVDEKHPRNTPDAVLIAFVHSFRAEKGPVANHQYQQKKQPPFRFAANGWIEQNPRQKKHANQGYHSQTPFRRMQRLPRPSAHTAAQQLGNGQDTRLL